MRSRPKTTRIGREPLIRQFAETVGCEVLLKTVARSAMPKL
jgi:hypothetical protein